MMSRYPAFFFALTALLLIETGASQAQSLCTGGHCDVMVERLMIAGDDCATQTFDPSQTVEYSQLATGARDFDVFPFRTLYPVYSYDERLLGNYSADDPGFNAVPNPCAQSPLLAPLPGSKGLYFDFLTEPPTAGGAGLNLLYWDALDSDGNGLDENDVEWSAVVQDEILRIDNSGSSVSNDGSTDEIQGMLIKTTSSSGAIHDHIDFNLRRASGGLPTQGVYLAKLDFTMESFAEGAPAYFVFSTSGSPLNSEKIALAQVENQIVFSLCDDGIDNDRDGLIDFSGGDPGCDSADDDSEKSVHFECDDGLDNDGDGLIDYRSDSFGSANLYATRDPQCDSQGASGISEVPEPSASLMLMAGSGLLILLNQKRAAAKARCS